MDHFITAAGRGGNDLRKTVVIIGHVLCFRCGQGDIGRKVFADFRIGNLLQDLSAVPVQDHKTVPADQTEGAVCPRGGTEHGGGAGLLPDRLLNAALQQDGLFFRCQQERSVIRRRQLR